MTFDAREYSAELGAPLLLAIFAQGVRTWRFVAADQDVIFGGNTYTAWPGGMDVGPVSDSQEVEKNNVQLKVDRTFPIAELWRVSPPVATVLCILREIHQDEAEDSVAWMGHVGNVSWTGEGQATITLSPGAMAMGSNGLRRRFEIGCGHVFMGPDCRLDPATVQHAATILTVEGTTVTAAEFAADKFAGGYFTWEDADDAPDYRFVMAHTDGSASVRILGAAPFLAPGTVVTAFEGCDHTAARCSELGNLDNHGGLPHFQGKNPYTNDPVY